MLSALVDQQTPRVAEGHVPLVAVYSSSSDADAFQWAKATAITLS